MSLMGAVLVVLALLLLVCGNQIPRFALEKMVPNSGQMTPKWPQNLQNEAMECPRFHFYVISHAFWSRFWELFGAL